MRRKSQLQKLKQEFNQAERSKNVPKRYTLLYKYASVDMKASGIPIQLPCDVEVFGEEKTIFVLDENLLALLKYEMLGQAIIAAYML